MTIKQSIILYLELEEKHDWIHSGNLERVLGEMLGKKDSNISRRCRELCNEGIFSQLTQMNIHFSSKSDLWSTPQKLFDELDAEFHFTLDPCSTHENAKCHKHFTQEEDGLENEWGVERVFMNPPYGREIGKWIKKAVESEALVVMLLPARTDTKWFHDYIYGKCEIRFLKGRLKFGNSKNSAPFPSMIVISNKLSK